MKKTLIVFLSLLAISAGAAGIYTTSHSHSAGSTVDDHSGGTNSDGCHTNHKTGNYHCHNRK